MTRSDYRHGGAQALVALHARYLREFLAVWRRADAYLEHVLSAWEEPLRNLTEEVADTRVFTSRWGVPYTIDAMLEHAVMHPNRHAHQLENLLAGQG